MRQQSYLIGVTLVLTSLFFTSVFHGQFYDGSNMQFGKNRVQYRTFGWQYFSVDNSQVFYYPNGREFAYQVGSQLNGWIKEVESMYDRKLTGGVQVLVFNSASDFYQSNIGSSLETVDNIGGTATLVGSKVFVFADGTWEHTEALVKKNLSELIFNQILYGGNWQEALRNSTSGLEFPEWFDQGLHSFISQPWSAELAMEVEDAARCNKILNAQRTAFEDARYVGHGIWKYITDVYGKGVIANLLYMIRVSNSLNDGLQYATGMPMDLVLSEASQYLLQESATADLYPPLNTRKALRKSRKETGDWIVPVHADSPIRSITFHPDGHRYAWSENEMGQLTIWLGDNRTGEVKKLNTYGNKIDRIQDSDPVPMAWHPNGNLLTYSVLVKSSPVLVSVDLTDFISNTKPLSQINKVLAMTYAPDGLSMAFSAVNKGRSDIFRYNVLGNNLTSKTADIYDDLDPVFAADGQSIWFTSNRPNADPDHAHVFGKPLSKNHDVFQLQWNGKEAVIEQWSSTPNSNERFPVILENGQVTTLTENLNGNQRRDVFWRDSVVAFIDTTIHYRYVIESQTIEAFQNPIARFHLIQEHNQLVKEHQLNGHLFLENTKLRPWESSSVELDINDTADQLDVIVDWEWRPQAHQADFRNYEFGASEVFVESDQAIEEEGTEDEQWQPFDIPRSSYYLTEYTIQSISSQLDNSYGANFYQAYNGNITVQPGLGGLSRISMTDLFENKIFTAGFRLSGSLENSRYMLSFTDQALRWDRSWIFERQGVTQPVNNQTYVNTHIHLLRRQWKYAIDEVRSLRIQGLFRLDRNTPLSTDAFNLTKPITFDNQVGIQVAYVLDNTRQRMINIPEGTRYRAWFEYYGNPSQRSETFGTIGIDFRTYRQLWRNIIWANRFSADWSIGEQRLLHLLGGVDNVLSLTPNAETPIDPNVNYAYQTRLAPLRGFNANARNGSHMALINSEIRIPIWSTLSNKPVESNLMETLQFVGFADVGSAWNGKHPYDSDNTFNQVTVTQNPITVTIDNNREPVIWGTGFGLRAKVLGYWLRTDWSWGVDDGRWQDRLFNLSLHLDF